METQAALIRPVRLADASDLCRNCFPEDPPGNVESYLRWCLTHEDRGRIVRLVAEVDGRVVGNGQLSLSHDQAEIGSLVVAAPYRGRGIGTALVQALVEHAKKHNLRTVEISASTDAPWIQAWYRRLGFVYQRSHTFPDQEQVIFLEMNLIPPPRRNHA
jgi:ribosomal protein S18 acetylase RimI-like enzyme